MHEASKLKRILSQKELNIFKGSGIDIGCGDDPITSNADKFDLAQGNAEHITEYVKRRYDFVFSSHCLEHMTDPWAAINEWWELVTPGGYMIIVVPDEDLYEQGHFPSIFNLDHKWTFTISKNKSWSPKSINFLDIMISLKQSKLIKIELQDNNYNRALLGSNSKNSIAKLAKVKRILRFFGIKVGWINSLLNEAKRVDQTLLPNTLAQIMAIAKKSSKDETAARHL